MANHIKFRAGELIVEDGTLDHKAYVVISGHVEVYKQKDTSKVTLAQLGPGQIFGEMGLISDRARGASVMAIDDVTLQVIDRDEFNNLLKKDPEILLPIMRVLFERLRNVNSLLLSSAGHIGAVKTNDAQPSVTISGITPQAQLVLGNQSLIITKFPFRIGRKVSEHAKDVFSNNDVYLEDREPYNISRNHFSINHQAGGFFIVDRGSTLGTMVNGVRIGGSNQSNSCPLDKSENEIVVGSTNSQFKFKVLVS